MKHIKLFIMTLALVIGVGSFAAPMLAHAASPKADVCNALGSGNDCSKAPSNGVDINKVISVVITTLSAVIGVISVIMVMLGGFKYVTSGGDSSKVASAKNTLIYAVVGLVVVALARVLVLFVIDKVK